MADIVINKSLRIRSEGLRLANTSRGGVVSLTGQEQVVASAAARWKMTSVFNIFSGEEDKSVLIYRSIVRRGRSTRIIVEERDVRGPGQLANLPLSGKRGVPHLGGVYFKGDVGYKSLRFNSFIFSAAQLNATQLDISLSKGLLLTPGMRFSTPDYRLHEIDEIISFDGNTNWTVRILPWLREAYPAGTILDFDTPKCAMRLASDTTGEYMVETRQMLNPSVDFVEYF